MDIFQSPDSIFRIILQYQGMTKKFYQFYFSGLIGYLLLKTWMSLLTSMAIYVTWSKPIIPQFWEIRIPTSQKLLQFLQKHSLAMLYLHQMKFMAEWLTSQNKFRYTIQSSLQGHPLQKGQKKYRLFSYFYLLKHLMLFCSIYNIQRPQSRDYIF